MALGRTYSVALVGLNGYIVEVEADIGQTLPAFVILGLPDASLNEAKERIRSAAQNSGIPLSRRKITANLIPASLPKRGSGFDLAIAMAVLLAANDIRPTGRTVFIAELGLDGRLRPVRGILPAVMAAVRAGYPEVVVARANVAEAELVPGARVRGYATLARLAFDCGADPQDLALDFEPETEDSGHPEPGTGSRPGAGHVRCLRPGGGAACIGSSRCRCPPPAADRTAGCREDHARRAAARAAAGPGRHRGHGGDRNPLAVFAAVGLRAAAAPPALREPAPHRDGGGHHRWRVRAAAARGGVPCPPRGALPGRGPGVRPRRPGRPAAAAGKRRAGHPPLGRVRGLSRPVPAGPCSQPLSLRQGNGQRSGLHLHAHHAPPVPGPDVRAAAGQGRHPARSRAGLARRLRPACGRGRNRQHRGKGPGGPGPPAGPAAAIRDGNQRAGAGAAAARVPFGSMPPPPASWTTRWSAEC